MNAVIRNTLLRAMVIVVLAAITTSVVGWLMRARFDVSSSPIVELRPSAWTALGIAAMVLPLAVGAWTWVNWVFNDPGSLSRALRTAITTVVGLGFLVAGVVVGVNDPFEGTNTGIFWRGLGSGVIWSVAILLATAIILPVANRLRRCEALLNDWHPNGWEAHLPN